MRLHSYTNTKISNRRCYFRYLLILLHLDRPDHLKYAYGFVQGDSCHVHGYVCFGQGDIYHIYGILALIFPITDDDMPWAIAWSIFHVQIYPIILCDLYIFIYFIM
jgi:hypothetical protein